MKKSYLIIFTIFILFPASLWGQTNYKQGYIIKIDGDTAKGYIDDRSDYRNANFVSFKSDLAAEAIKYQPENLASYHIIGGKSYVSKTIAVNTINAIIRSHLFLEALVIGRASLYYYKDAAKEEYFYIEKDAIFKRITSEERLITDQDGRTLLSRSNKYIHILNDLFKDCASWNTKADYEFHENSLKRVVRRYNNCFNESISTVDAIDTNVTERKLKVNYIVNLGINRSTVSESGEQTFLDRELKDPRPILGIHGGIAVELVIPRINDKFSLELGLSFNRKGVDDKIVFQRYEFKHAVHTTYKMDFLDVSAMGKYTYPKGKIRPFIGIGLLFGYLLNKGSAFKITKQVDNRPPVTTNGVLFTTAYAIEIGYCGEIGVRIPVFNKNNVNLSLRYEASSLPANDYNTYIYTIQTLQFKVGYRFK